MEGMKEFATNWNEFWSICKGFFHGCKTTFNFVNNCFAQEGFLIESLKSIAPSALLISLSILLILKVLGFQSSNKWIALSFVLALIVAAL